MLKAPNSWADLSDVMRKQTKKYEKFLEVLKKKEKALVAGDIDKLTKIIKEEEKNIHELELIENKRIKIVAQCLPGHGGSATLKDALMAVPPEEKEELETSALDLMKAIGDVARTNRMNAELIKESMNFTTYNINLLTSDRTLDNLYESTGRMKGSEPKVRAIINKEV